MQKNRRERAWESFKKYRRVIGFWGVVVSTTGFLTGLLTGYNPLSWVSASSAVLSAILVTSDYEERLSKIEGSIVTAVGNQGAKVDALPLSVDKVLKEYVVPKSLEGHPLMDSRLAKSLRELAAQHWRTHDGGDLPVVEGFTSTVTIGKLTPREEESCVAPAVKDIEALGGRTEWLAFRMDSRWELHPPPYVAKNTKVNPLDYLGRTFVTEAEVYVQLARDGLLTSDNWLYPLPRELSDHAQLGPILRTKVAYLRPAEKRRWTREKIHYGAEDGAYYHVFKHHKNRVGSPDGWVKLEKLDNVAKILRLNPDTASSRQIEAGVIQAYGQRYATDRCEAALTIDLPPERDVEKDVWHWEVFLKHDYFLPVRVELAGETIWAQTSFEFPVGRVSKYTDVTVRLDDSVPDLKLERPFLSAVMGGGHFQIVPHEPDTGREWKVSTTDFYLFPGDIFIFKWGPRKARS